MSFWKELHERFVKVWWTPQRRLQIGLETVARTSFKTLSHPTPRNLPYKYHIKKQLKEGLVWFAMVAVVVVVEVVVRGVELKNSSSDSSKNSGK